MVQISWIFDTHRVEQLAVFFSKNITLEYISHSELQGQRTTDSGQWVANLIDIFKTEIRDATTSAPLSLREKEYTRNICAAYKDDILLGLAYVSVTQGPSKCYSYLEDIVVDKNRRGEDIGGQLISWIIKELESIGIRKIFLESGMHNENAHHFFEKFGFQQSSIVMVR